MMNSVLAQDKIRYGGRVPHFQALSRKAPGPDNKRVKGIYKALFILARKRNHIELSVDCQIGPGLYIGHPYCITVNPGAVLGKNINLHKGVTIGEEHRGKRAGYPVIGDNVWIGVNATIVGKVHIGNDVLIAANCFVNCDVPDHSIVFGNPCIIKHREDATAEYINRAV